MTSNNNEAKDAVPVLIVGGGPVGLGLALELAKQNVRSVLIEQADGDVTLSKMGHVSVRSMESCRRWGVSDEVRNCGFPVDYPHNQIFCTSLNGIEVGTIEVPSHTDDTSFSDISPERKQRCPQLWFDPILRRAAEKSPLITLTYFTRMIGFTQDETGVTAQVEDVQSGERRQIRAQYLVGADGGNSKVRETLGFYLEGEVLSYSVSIYFTSRDLLKHQKMPTGTRYWLIGEEGTWGNLTVVDGKDIWRLTITGSMEKVEASDFDADYWLRRCLGRDDIAYSITAVMPWRRPRMVANHYGKGRVYMVGDACRLNTPNGGFGMNTGLDDVVNLGWKLRGAIEGWASPDLFASYEAERRPIAIRNTTAAAENFRLTKPDVSYENVEASGPVGEAARKDLFAALSRDTGPEWETIGVFLGYRYEGSPAIIGDGTPEPEDDLSVYVPTARPGHRAPHFWVKPGQSVLDLFGDAFVLLDFGGNANGASARLQDAARELGVPFKVAAIDNAAAHRLYERRYVLVRPDGHVAWRGDALDIAPEALIGTIVGKKVGDAAHRALATT